MKNLLFLTFLFTFFNVWSQEETYTKNFRVKKTFKNGKSHRLRFDIPQGPVYADCSLSFYGTDYDADRDGDFTDFFLIVNGDTVIWAKEFATLGAGKSGDYANAVFNVFEYLNYDDNVVVFGNSEDDGQTDYFKIKNVQLKCEIIDTNTLYGKIIDKLQRDGFSKSINTTLFADNQNVAMFSKKFYKGNQYIIIAFGENGTFPDSMCMYNTDLSLYQKDDTEKIKVIAFTPEETSYKLIKLTANHTDASDENKIHLLIYYR